MKNNSEQLIIEQILQKNFATLYVLEGEESFFIDNIINVMENEIIPEEEKDLNLMQLYGNETTANDIINEAMSMPMFGERRLLIVKEAQNIKDLSPLISYFENPNPTTIFVLEHKGKTLDKRSKFAKTVNNYATHFIAERIKDSDLPSWIINAGQSFDLKISMEIATMLSIYLGNDLHKINNELNKIKINEPDLKKLTPAIIERQIGISREYNVIELSNAVFQNDKVRIARMLNYFNANPKNAALPAVLGMFHGFLQRVFISYYIPQNNDFKNGIFAAHRSFSNQYNISYYHQLSCLMEEYSHRSVGIDSSYSASPHLLKEMIARIGSVLDSKP